MAESELECFIGVKTAESSKGEIERKKKHKNVKLKENVPGAMLPREKPEECTMCYRSSNSNKRFEANVHILAGYVLPFVFYKMPDQASSHLTKFQSQRDVVISHIPHTYSKEMASKSQTVSISNASSPLLFLDCGSAAKILITQYRQLRRLLPPWENYKLAAHGRSPTHTCLGQSSECPHPPRENHKLAAHTKSPTHTCLGQLKECPHRPRENHKLAAHTRSPTHTCLDPHPHG